MSAPIGTKVPRLPTHRDERLIVVSRRAQTFRQYDLTRALRAAQKAGFHVVSVEIEGGKIVIYSVTPDHVRAPNAWDVELAP